METASRAPSGKIEALDFEDVDGMEDFSFLERIEVKDHYDAKYEGLHSYLLMNFARDLLRKIVRDLA